MNLRGYPVPPSSSWSYVCRPQVVLVVPGAAHGVAQLADRVPPDNLVNHEQVLTGVLP